MSVILSQRLLACHSPAYDPSHSREEHEEDAPILAPIFHKYGHALLEHAIATSGALGGGGGGAKDAPMPSRSNGASKTVASARADKATTDKDGEKAVAAGEMILE